MIFHFLLLIMTRIHKLDADAFTVESTTRKLEDGDFSSCQGVILFDYDISVYVLY